MQLLFKSLGIPGYGLAGVVLFLSCTLSYAADTSIYGVLYPESHGPYQAVFKSVVSGIDHELNDSLSRMMIEDPVDIGDVDHWIKRNGIRVLITLGNQNIGVCESLPSDVKLIAGAILTPPEKGCHIQSGIALAPHPERLFDWLLRLKPGVKTVYVVYSPEFNSWLMKYADTAARARHLKLVTYQADSLEQAARQYQQIIGSDLGQDDAVWLPQDPHTVDQKTILPLLLRQAWNNQFIVFSSNAADVKRGVLFGLYPDFEAMGASLGRLARDGIKNPAIQPLTDVLIAVNLRTADHLKLNLNGNVRDTFNLTFPASR